MKDLWQELGGSDKIFFELRHIAKHCEYLEQNNLEIFSRILLCFTILMRAAE